MKRNYINKIVSIALVMALAFTGTLSASSKMVCAASVDYISKIKIVNAKGFNEEEFIKKGWKVAKGELNISGNDKKKLLYKTTKNRFNAITDIRLMNEKGGYSAEMFKQAMENQTNNVAQMVQEWEVIVNEFKNNYNAGKTPAKYAKQLLDFYVEDDSCDIKAGKFVTVGDIFVKDTYDRETVSKILLEGNSRMVALIEEALAMGCSEVLPSEEELDALVEREDYTPDMEPTWLYRAQSLSYTSQGFDTAKADIASMLLKVSETVKVTLNNYKDLSSKAENHGKEVDEYVKEEVKTVEDEVNTGKNFNSDTATYDNQADTLMDVKSEDMYKILSGLKYNKNGQEMTFAEFFMQDNLETYDFLPLANALTDGQARLLYYIGVEQLITFSDRTVEEWKSYMDTRISETEKMIKTVSDNMKGTDEELEDLTDIEKDDAETKADLLVKANKMSIYAGVNRAMFDHELASQGLIVLTSDAMVQSAAKNDKSWLESNTKADKKINIVAHSLRGVGVVALTTLGTVVAAVGDKMVLKIQEIAEEKMLAQKISMSIEEKYNYYVAGNVFRIAGGTLILLAAVALLAWEICELVVYLKGKANPVHDKVPEIIVNQVSTARVGTQDLEINKFVSYEVVKDDKEVAANLNDNSVLQWYCMYVTKDQNAGNPLTADDIVIGKEGTSEIDKAASAEEKDKSYVSVKDFGSRGCANFNKYVPKQGDKVEPAYYVYFTTDTTDVNQDTGTATSSTYFILIGVMGAVVGAGIMYAIMALKKKD